jgi:hypothetical protein
LLIEEYPLEKRHQDGHLCSVAEPARILRTEKGVAISFYEVVYEDEAALEKHRAASH